MQRGTAEGISRLTTGRNREEFTRRIERDKQDIIFLRVIAMPEYLVNGRPLTSVGQQQLLDIVRDGLDKAW